MEALAEDADAAAPGCEDATADASKILASKASEREVAKLGAGKQAQRKPIVVADTDSATTALKGKRTSSCGPRVLLHNIHSLAYSVSVARFIALKNDNNRP